MKELKKEDLQIGDILIFEDFDFDPKKLERKTREGGIRGAFYYLLHYLIAWFDPGKEGDHYRNIYHAAIWGNVNVNRDKGFPEKFEDCVVQAGTTGIGYASFEATMTHETVMNVYVCRKKARTEDFEGEINSAIRNFYKERGHYSFETAWLLAVICSLRYSDATLYQLLEDRFGKLTAHLIVAEILKLINYYNDHHQKDMVACSILVAMIYKNAGHELPVHVFETLNYSFYPSPKFEISEQLFEGLQANVQSAEHNWPILKETVVSPRQLMESPEVELIGVLRHQ